MGDAEQKKRIRKEISILKKQMSEMQRTQFSLQLQNRIENHPRFKSAKTVLLYSALPDEPETKKLINRWHDTKKILLPVVVGEELVLKEYEGENLMKTGAFGIKEPQGKDFNDYLSIDLAIIPGVAFDQELNRLGRGKGYYDRLLLHPDIKAYKMGCCFPFQIVQRVPAEPHDFKMDEVIFQ